MIEIDRPTRTETPARDADEGDARDGHPISLIFARRPSQDDSEATRSLASLPLGHLFRSSVEHETEEYWHITGEILKPSAMPGDTVKVAE